MIITIVIDLANMCLNLLFVYGFDIDSDGVAFGTLLANYLGFGVGIFFFLKKFLSESCESQKPFC